MISVPQMPAQPMTWGSAEWTAEHRLEKPIKVKVVVRRPASNNLGVGPPFQLWRTALGGRDGRQFSEQHHAGGISAHTGQVRTEIRERDTEIELRLGLSNFERPRRPKARFDRSFVHLCGMAAMIMRGDIHRQTVRSGERQVDKTVAIVIDPSGLPDELREAASGWIEDLLQELSPSAYSLKDSQSEVEPS